MVRTSLGTLLSAIVVVCGLSLSAAEDDAKEVKHEYVGVKKCKICHKKDGVFPSWEKSKHATAWDSLSAVDQKNEKLQQYYTTGTAAKGEVLTGIQCEACHGPGSDYKKKSIMEDQKKAFENGLLIPDENTCKRCHNEKAPKALAKLAKDFDFKKMVAKGVHEMRVVEKETPKQEN